MCTRNKRNWRNKKLKLKREQHGICWLCGKPMSERNMTFDHIIPRSKGGSNVVENLRLAHRSCNAQRGNSDGIAFERHQGTNVTRQCVKDVIPEVT